MTGLNDLGNTVGFWANKAGADFGFYTSRNGAFHEVNFLTGTNSSPQMDQLLGINDHGMAVGFYANQDGNIRGYEYNIHTGVFKRVVQPGVSLTVHTPSLTAAAINNYGAIAGFYVTGGGVTDGFVRSGHHFTKLAYPGATMTQAFGINDSGEVRGRLHRRQRQLGEDLRVHLDSLARVHRGQRPARHRHDPHQRHQRPRRAGRLLHRHAGPATSTASWPGRKAGNQAGTPGRPDGSAAARRSAAALPACVPEPRPGKHGVVKIGVVFPQTELGGDRGAVRAYAQRVEELGFTHCWPMITCSAPIRPFTRAGPARTT